MMEESAEAKKKSTIMKRKRKNSAMVVKSSFRASMMVEPRGNYIIEDSRFALGQTGWLQKKAKSLAGYQWRFFIASGRYLRYFADESCSELLAAVDVAGSDVDAFGKRTLALRRAKAKFVLRCSNERERNDWLAKLIHMASARPQSSIVSSSGHTKKHNDLEALPWFSKKSSLQEDDLLLPRLKESPVRQASQDQQQEKKYFDSAKKTKAPPLPSSSADDTKYDETADDGKASGNDSIDQKALLSATTQIELPFDAAQQETPIQSNELRAESSSSHQEEDGQQQEASRPSILQQTDGDEVIIRQQPSIEPAPETTLQEIDERLTTESTRSNQENKTFINDTDDDQSKGKEQQAAVDHDGPDISIAATAKVETHHEQLQSSEIKEETETAVVAAMTNMEDDYMVEEGRETSLAAMTVDTQGAYIHPDDDAMQPAADIDEINQAEKEEQSVQEFRETSLAAITVDTQGAYIHPDDDAVMQSAADIDEANQEETEEQSVQEFRDTSLAAMTIDTQGAYIHPEDDAVMQSAADIDEANQEDKEEQSVQEFRDTSLAAMTVDTQGAYIHPDNPIVQSRTDFVIGREDESGAQNIEDADSQEPSKVAANLDSRDDDTNIEIVQDPIAEIADTPGSFKEEMKEAESPLAMPSIGRGVSALTIDEQSPRATAQSSFLRDSTFVPRESRGSTAAAAGTLLKKHGTKWRLRYFLLYGQYLRYFKSDSPGAPLLGAVNIRNITIHPVKDDGFSITTDDDRVLHFRSDDRKAAEKWVATLIEMQSMLGGPRPSWSTNRRQEDSNDDFKHDPSSPQLSARADTSISTATADLLRTRILCDDEEDEDIDNDSDVDLLSDTEDEEDDTFVIRKSVPGLVRKSSTYNKPAPPSGVPPGSKQCCACFAVKNT